MANEELQSFTDRLDQLFTRRSIKESSHLEGLGKEFEDASERTVNHNLKGTIGSMSVGSIDLASNLTERGG